MTPDKQLKNIRKDNRSQSNDKMLSQRGSKVKALFGSVVQRILRRRGKNGVDVKDNSKSQQPKIIYTVKHEPKSERDRYSPPPVSSIGHPDVDDEGLINDTESSYFGDDGSKKKRA